MLGQTYSVQRCETDAGSAAARPLSCVSPESAMKFRFLPLLISMLAVGVAAVAYASVPTTAVTQGHLASQAGGAVSDGTYNMTFAIYAGEAGGLPVWTEGPASVDVKTGIFIWNLGSKVPLVPANLSLPAAWVGVQIGSDPELPRQPLASVLYAQRAAVAEAVDCSGCIKAAALDAGVLQPFAKTTDLAAYAKTTDLAPYAKTADLAPYAKTADLAPYAKSTDLAPYAKSAALADYAKAADLVGFASKGDLGDYVKAASLAPVAGTGSYNDLLDKPVLAKVATTGKYTDLSGLPVLAQLGKTCGTGLVVKGLAVDGSLVCGTLSEKDMPPDGIDEVSNGLIYNQFVDTKAGTTDVVIKDGLTAGVTDTLTFPDIGVAQKVSITATVANSDMSKVRIELYGPGTANPYILYDGGKTGTTMTATFNDTTAIVAGDINKEWVGKNIAGPWSLTVKDLAAGGGSGGVDGKFNWAVNIQTLSSKKVEVKGDLIVDGNIVNSGPFKTNYATATVTGPHTANSGGGWALLDANLKATLTKVQASSVIKIHVMMGALETNNAWGWGGVEVRMDGAVITNPWGCGSEYYGNSDQVRADTISCIATAVPAGAHTFTVWWNHVILEDVGQYASDGRQSAHATLWVEEVY